MADEVARVTATLTNLQAGIGANKQVITRLSNEQSPVTGGGSARPESGQLFPRGN